MEQPTPFRKLAALQKPLHADDLLSPDWLTRVGCVSITIDLICGCGMTWRQLAEMDGVVLQRITGDSRFEFLISLAKTLVSLDESEVEDQKRREIMEYLLGIDDPVARIRELIDSVAYFMSARADLERAFSDRATKMRYAKAGRALKELFRHAVHTLIRV